MNILFLQEQPCVRTLKYAQGLKEYDGNIKLSFGYYGKTLTQLYGTGDELFCHWIKMNDIPPEDITKTKILMTMIDGVEVFRSPELDQLI